MTIEELTPYSITLLYVVGHDLSDALPLFEVISPLNPPIFIIYFFSLFIFFWTQTCAPSLSPATMLYETQHGCNSERA